MNPIRSRTLDVLSVDWDWFFPDTEEFDWTHTESSIYLELVWALRGGSHSLLNPTRKALDVMWPDPARLGRFWERTVKMAPWGIAVCESHRDLFTWIVDGIQPKKVRIVNYDAHHDCGYKLGLPAVGPLDCGNWAAKLREKKLLESYTVVYPPWRKSAPEDRVPRFCKITLEPPPLARYDFVFMCRSGAWTPTWADHQWIKFVEWWKEPLNGFFWERKVHAPFALKVRSPNLEEAVHNAKEQEKAFQLLKKEA